MESLIWLAPDFSYAEWLVHGGIFVLNIGLFFLIGPILSFVEHNGEKTPTPHVLRAISILIITLVVLNVVFHHAHEDYQNYFIKIGLSLLIIYWAFLIYTIAAYFLLKKFGNEKNLDDKPFFIETYSSRIVSILLLIFIVFSAVYALIITWGADSMLETTGVFGIIVAFLAFTSSIWAPDIISGLIILNTQMLEDGDVVIIDGYPDEYVISKVSFIYIILYDIRNNHRTLIRNNRFIQSKIDNISRVASTDGIRKKLVFQIAYPHCDADNPEQRLEQLQQFNNRVDRLFTRAFDSASEQETIKINRNKPFEWALTSTGNYALEYSLWFYLERIPNTKVTATIRKHLMRTIYRVNEEVFKASVAEQLDLATPDLAHITLDDRPTATAAAAPQPAPG